MAKSTSEVIEWKAAESIDHERSTGWYVVLYGIALIVIGLCIWQQNWITIGLVVIIVIALQVVGSKPSRMIDYAISSDGLSIDGKVRPWSDFRGFGVRHDGHFWNLVMIPTARFGLEQSIFIRDDHGEEIVDFLGKILPMEQLNKDFIGHLARKLKL